MPKIASLAPQPSHIFTLRLIAPCASLPQPLHHRLFRSNGVPKIASLASQLHIEVDRAGRLAAAAAPPPLPLQRRAEGCLLSPAALAHRPAPGHRPHNPLRHNAVTAAGDERQCFEIEVGELMLGTGKCVGIPTCTVLVLVQCIASTRQCSDDRAEGTAQSRHRGRRTNRREQHRASRPHGVWAPSTHLQLIAWGGWR